MNRFFAAIPLALTLIMAPLAQAQTYTDSDRVGLRASQTPGLGIEMRFGQTITTDNFGSSDLGNGATFEFHGVYQLSRNFGLYTGVTGAIFDANNDFTSRDNLIADLGYVAGVRLNGGFGQSRVGWRLHGGANYGEIKLYEEDTDSNIGASGHKLGWEAGAAITIDLPNEWVLSPGVTYRSRSANLRTNGIDREVDLNYVTVGVGLGVTF